MLKSALSFSGLSNYLVPLKLPIFAMEIGEPKALFRLTSPCTLAPFDLLEEGTEFKRDRCSIDSAP